METYRHIEPGLNAQAIALCDAAIFTGEAMVEGHALVLKDGKILDIVRPNALAADTKKVSYPDQILTAGFIDLQVNGGGNLLFNNSPTAETCSAIAQAHAKYGTTRLLPTIITDKPETTRAAIDAMRIARKSCPNILGIHIEGPHLGVERRGVHKADYIRAITDEDLKLYQRQGDEVILMTVAPENVTPDQIKKLRQHGVTVSIGHTNAPPDQIKAALAAGATGFTHLFNGMGKPSPNGTTPADTALKDKGSWCGIIADGFHVPEEMFKLALHSKQKGKIFLVSDAMPCAATNNPQPFQLYGETIHAENGRCVSAEGKLAGSSITLADAVHTCVSSFHVELEEALRMASLYPATFLGIHGHYGKLLPGYMADVTAIKPAA